MYFLLFLTALTQASPVPTNFAKDPSVKKSVLNEDRREIKEPEEKVSFSFNQTDYILAPQDRVQALNDFLLEKEGKAAGFFLEKFKKVDPRCLFPGKGYYTVFIPRDSAFNDFSTRVIESYNKDELCKYLEKHVIREIITLRDVEEPVAYTTVGGTKVTLDNKYGRYTINKALIGTPFVYTKNGVIVHLVDGLIVNP